MWFAPVKPSKEGAANAGHLEMSGDADTVDYGFTFTLVGGQNSLIPSS